MKNFISNIFGKGENNHPVMIPPDTWEELVYGHALSAYKCENMPLAFHHFQELSRLGFPVADYQLYKMYYKGKGTTRNFDKAFESLTLSAERGYPQAYARMAVSLYEGIITEEDKEQAVIWAYVYKAFNKVPYFNTEDYKLDLSDLEKLDYMINNVGSDKPLLDLAPLQKIADELWNSKFKDLSYKRIPNERPYEPKEQQYLRGDKIVNFGGNLKGSPDPAM